jgi:hypothetical protein
MLKNKISISITITIFLCIILSCSIYYTKVNSFNKNNLSDNGYIDAPTKIHLKDGSVIIVEGGFLVNGKKLTFTGQRFDITRSKSSFQKSIEIDSIANIEYYQEKWNGGAFLASLPPNVAFYGMGTTILLVAMFGSCPTIYTFDGNDYTLEAEAFSYSIAKMFETNDLDKLNKGRLINGEYILKVTNEALETHYINKMNLIVADYPQGFEALPTENQEIMLKGTDIQPMKVINRSGQDLSNLLLNKDLMYYQTDTSITKQLTQKVTNDWIDVEVNVPEGVDKIYLGMNIRNTLLNTILLYDVMFGSQGFKAVDWLDKSSYNIFYSWQFYRWYQKYFGIHIKKFNGKEFKEVQRISDTGPISWHELGAIIPVEAGKTEHLRFEFIADNMQIDWLGLSFVGNEKCNGKVINCSELLDTYRNNKNSSINLFNNDDKDYFVTYPSDGFIMKYKVGEVPDGMKRSFFITSRGFYIEWLRQDWLTKSTVPKGFEFDLNEESIKVAARIWLSKKASFEREFYESRINVKGGVLQ